MRLRSNKHRKKKKKKKQRKSKLMSACLPPTVSHGALTSSLVCFFVCLFVLYQLALARTKDFAKQGELLKPNAK